MLPFPVRSVSIRPALFGLSEYGLEMGLNFKDSEKTTKPLLDIKILASKPRHAYQERLRERNEITAKFDELKSLYGGENVLGVYMQGGPAIGKTQIAREFGEQYYRELKISRKVGGTSGKIAVVAMLDARTPASFLRSYLRLAEDLGFPVDRYVHSAESNKIQDRIAIISSDVQKKLAETAPDWLLIVDGIDAHCKLLQFRF